MKTILKTILAFTVAAMLAWCVWTLVAFQIVIKTDGNLPTLVAGDRVLVNRVAYGWKRPLNALFGKMDTCCVLPDKGHLMAFHNPLEATAPANSGNLCIGECAALPGDTVWLPWKSPFDTTATRASLHPFVVPGKNITIDIQPWNIALLSNALHTHEHANICYESDSLLNVNGKPTHLLTFSKDYIWVGNPAKPTDFDSMTFGFLPCNLLVGKLICTTYSVESDKPFFHNLRLNRFLTSVEKLQKDSKK